VTSFFSEWLSAVSKLSLYVGALSFDCDQAVQHHRALGAYAPATQKHTPTVPLPATAAVGPCQRRSSSQRGLQPSQEVRSLLQFFSVFEGHSGF
jgi:hypothetical protein